MYERGLVAFYKPDKNMKFFRADIRGFTKTGASFIKKSKYGAEEISDMIEAIISPTVDFIYEKDGKVLLFSGDGMLFFLRDEKDIHELKDLLKGNIDNYNSSKGTDIGVKIERLNQIYNPHIVEGSLKKAFFFHPHPSREKDFDNYSFNDFFPDVIVEMFEKGWLGELLEIPVGFINIPGDIKPEGVIPLFKEIVDLSYIKGLYLNKIDWDEKGWMLLISAGSPLPLKNSPVVLYEFTSDILKTSVNMGIPIRFGFTLDKGFAGINGNRNRWEFTFFGANVNLAARISTTIPFNIIGVDASFKEKTGDFFDFEPVGRYRMKGFEKKKEVYTISEKKKKIIRIPIAGRKQELNEIKSFLSTPYSSVLMEGESGIGKTALLNKIESSLRSIRIKGIYNNVIPFLPFETFSVNFQNIANLLKPSVRLNFMKRASLSIREDAERENFIKNIFKNIFYKVILIVDDATYLEKESLDIIKWLFYEGNENINILIAGIDLKNFNFVDSPLSKYRVKRMKLKGLSVPEIKEFISGYVNMDFTQSSIKLLYNISGGNPLFILHILDFLMKEKMLKRVKDKFEITGDIKNIPFSLKEIIRLKINQLKDSARDFINAGSIIGEDFEASISGKCLNMEPQEIESTVVKAEDIKILRDKKGDTCSFFHSIVRNTVYESMLKKNIINLSNRLAQEYLKIGSPLHIYRAGSIIKEIDRERGAEILLKAVEEGIKKRDFKTAHLSLKELLKFSLSEENIKKSLKFFNILNISERDTIIAMYKKIQTLKDFCGVEDDVLQFSMNVGETLRDKKIMEFIIKNYEKEEYEKSFSYYMAKALLTRLKEEAKKASEIYEYVKNNIKMDKETLFKFYLTYTGFYFFEHGDSDRVKEGIERLKEMVKDIEDPQLLLNYYSLMDSLHLHWSEYEEAESYILKAIPLARKMKEQVDRAWLYNDLSIIYQRKSQIHNERKYMDRSIRYAEKVYNILKEKMFLSSLPLITTNLATSYKNRGRTKKAIKYYYEGLLYGKEVSHPVEVPYTLYMMSQMFLYMGGVELAINLVKEHKDTNVIDLFTYINTLLHLYGGYPPSLLEKAKEVAYSMMDRKILRPLSDFYRLHLYKNYMEDKPLMELKKEMEKDIEKYKTTHLNSMLRLIRFIYKEEEPSSIEEELERNEHLGLYFLLDVMEAIELARHYREKGNTEKGEKFIKMAYRRARKMRLFPLLLKILDISIKWGYREKYYKNVKKEMDKKLRTLASIDNLEKFMEIYEDLI